MTVDLAGLRILVAKDEALLGGRRGPFCMDIVAEIEDHQGVVLGPVATLDAGIQALREQKPDTCIVNINLGPNKVYELADLLIAERVPFVFASIEPRAAIPSRFSRVPLHTKPIKMVEATAASMRNEAPLLG